MNLIPKFYASALHCLFQPHSGVNNVQRSSYYIIQNGFVKYYSTKYKNRHKSTHFEVLGIPPSSTGKEIKAAFIRLSKEYHPDKNPDDPSLHRKFAEINEAYSVLKNRTPVGKTTGEQNAYADSEDWGADDYVDMEHHAYMSSREYFYYTKERMEEHNASVRNINKNHRDISDDTEYSYSGVIIALLSVLSLGGFSWYLGKRRSQDTEAMQQKRSAYFDALAQKLREDKRKFKEERLKRRYKIYDFSGQGPDPKDDKNIDSEEKATHSDQNDSRRSELHENSIPSKDINSSNISNHTTNSQKSIPLHINS